MDGDEEDADDDPMPFGVRVAVTVWRVYGLLWGAVAVGLTTCGIYVALVYEEIPGLCCLILSSILFGFFLVTRRETAAICEARDASLENMMLLHFIIGILHLLPVCTFIFFAAKDGNLTRLMNWGAFFVLGAFWTPGCSLLITTYFSFRDAGVYNQWASRQRCKADEARRGNG